MATAKGDDEAQVKVEIGPADDWTTVLLLSGAWGTSFAIFSSNVATLTLAVAPTAPSAKLETLPLGLALVMQGVATMALPAKVRVIGRKYMYLTGAMIGLLSIGLLALGRWLMDFSIQCLGASLLGYSLAHAQNYRFGAIQAMPMNPPRAISAVLFGGVVGALVGAGGISQARDWLPVEFAGVYLCGAVLNVVEILLLSFVKLPVPSPQTKAASAAPPRHLSQILRQPRVGAAIVAMISSYSIMLVLMAPTPTVMNNFYDHSFTASMLTMMGHMFCMFAPSPITGMAIARVGSMAVICAGLVCTALTALVLYLGTGLTFFVIGMALLGFAWNFMFIGGSALLTTAHTPAEGPKIQAVSDCGVFLGAASFTLVSMPMVSIIGWLPIQLVNLAMTAATALIIGVLWAIDRRQAADSTNF